MELGVAYFISGFKLAVLLPITLNRVICQMNKNVLDIARVIEFRTCPQIALTIPEKLGCFPHSYHEEICSDIELSLLVKEEASEILLDYEFAIASVAAYLFSYGLVTCMHRYSLPAV